ncbi:MAG: hypothetical protein JXB05_00285 [Myxococcaceae bacterium]|nr:hypothetical protein [Myxococcaceae bacterium]
MLPALTCLALLGCASSARQGEGTDYGFEGNPDRVWVKGPWEAINPSHDIDAVIDQLCPAVMGLPRARERDFGQEYCGVIYKLLSEDKYYASKPSPLGRAILSGDSKRKTCLIPRRVRDSRGALRPDADFHGHPWFPSGMSREDRMGQNQWYMFRIQFDTACRVQKLVPHVDSDRPAELYERQGQSWRLVGHILPEDKGLGYVTTVHD